MTADLSSELLDEAVTAYINPVLRLLPVPGVREALVAVRERGVRLAVISNTGRTPGVVLRQVLHHYGFLGFFTTLSYSDEIGYRKPHPEIFRETLLRMGAEPARALHIGDDAAADVAGARSVGMRVCHFRAHGGGGSPEADFILDDLADLPDCLARLAEVPQGGF